MRLRVVPGYPDYMVSDTGLVFSRLRRGRKRAAVRHESCTWKMLTQWRRSNGFYRGVMLAGKKFLVHRLVASAFLPGLGPKDHVHHANNDVTDNRLENLVVMTSKEHRQTYQLRRKLNAERVLEMRKLYTRGWTLDELAAHFDVHPETVYRAVRGISWRRLPGAVESRKQGARKRA